jgi:hypothetical protein
MYSSRKCKQCGGDIDRWRKAYTCSDVCRKQYSRRREYMGKAKNNIFSSLALYRQYLKKHPDLTAELNADLRRLQDEIRDLLQLRPDKEEMERRAMLEGISRSQP